MSKNTKIEWCDSTLNLMMGCDGCELWNSKVRTCYAGILIDDRYGGVNPGFPESFDKPQTYPERLAKALRWKDLTGTERPDKPWLNGLPRLIFLDDMGDTFTESLPLDWLAVHLPAMADSPHQFLCLTKRPSRMRQFSERFELPLNFWPGTSITKQQDRRVQELLGVRGGGPKFVSAEPLLGPVDFNRSWLIPWDESDGPCGPDVWNYMFVCRNGHPAKMYLKSESLGPVCLDSDCRAPVSAAKPGIDWIIVGGESGPDARPCNVEWIRSIRDQCAAAGTACFVKQLGSNVVTRNDMVEDCFNSLDNGWPDPHVEHHIHGFREDYQGADCRIRLRDPKGGDPSEWPADLRVRQVPGETT